MSTDTRPSLAELRGWATEELASCDAPECEECARFSGVIALLDIAEAAEAHRVMSDHLDEEDCDPSGCWCEDKNPGVWKTFEAALAKVRP
jgi:hypothetical protein